MGNDVTRLAKRRALREDLKNRWGFDTIRYYHFSYEDAERGDYIMQHDRTGAVVSVRGCQFDDGYNVEHIHEISLMDFPTHNFSEMTSVTQKPAIEKEKT